MKAHTMEKPFFYFEKFKTWETIATALYFVLTAWIYLNYKEWPAAHRQDVLMIYAMGTQAFIFVYLYVALRNFAFYLIWLGFGLIHLLFYSYAKNDHVAMLRNGNACGSLRITVGLLIVFQLARFMSLDWQKQEFAMPNKYGPIDKFANEKVTKIDYAIFVFYIVCIVFLYWLYGF